MIEDHQQRIKALIFSKRRRMFDAVQKEASVRVGAASGSGLISWPHVLLHITEDDWEQAIADEEPEPPDRRKDPHEGFQREGELEDRIQDLETMITAKGIALPPEPVMGGQDVTNARMRLLVFSCRTEGEVDMAICKPSDVVTCMNELIVSADGVEDITGQWDRAVELVAHFDECHLCISDDVRAYITTRGRLPWGNTEEGT